MAAHPNPGNPSSAYVMRFPPNADGLWWVVCPVCGNAMFVGYFHRKADANRAARNHHRRWHAGGGR